MNNTTPLSQIHSAERRKPGPGFPLTLIHLTLIASTTVGCVSLSQEQSRKPLIELASNQAGRDRVFDPVSGATYFIPCNPCKLPAQKTLAAAVAPAITTEPAQPSAVSNAVLASAVAYPAAVIPPEITSASVIARAPVPETPAGTKMESTAGTTYPGLDDDHLKLKLDTVLASVQRSIPFAFSASATGPRGRKALAEIVPLAKQSQRITIVGHTDSRGSESKNQWIARTRATTVMHAIVSAGVPQEAINTDSCTTCYVASNNTEAGRRANRRVEIEFVMPAVLAANLPKPIYSAPHQEDGPKMLAKLDSNFDSLGSHRHASAAKESGAMSQNQ